MEGDAILSVQIGQHREVAELRWDGATELIRVQQPERATMTQMRTIEDASYAQIVNRVSHHRLASNIRSEIIHSANGGRCDSECTKR